MSVTTSGVAVAVKARKGALGIIFLIFLIFRYDGLKSYPHCEIQWASSITIRRMFSDFKSLQNLSLDNLYGDTYKNLHLELISLSQAVVASLCVMPAWK